MKFEHSSEVKIHMAMIVFLPHSNSTGSVDDMLNSFTNETLFRVMQDFEEESPISVDIEFPKLPSGGTYNLDGVNIFMRFYFRIFFFI